MNLIISALLYFIAWALTPVVELLTFILVVFKYGKECVHYFDDEGYKLDVKSAGRNRTLWNFVFLLNKGKFPFKKDTSISISAYLGANSYYYLTWFGWLVYYLLYAVDFTEWHNGGHCRASAKKVYKNMLPNL